MKLNRLPVLIRTEVTAAAVGASLPAVYSRALVALEEAVNELSFAKLKTVEVSVEGLAAWAKAHQDEKLTKTARELKFRARRTANYIAEKLVAQRKATFIARGGVQKCKWVPAGEPESGGVVDVLRGAGYTPGEVGNIRASARVSDTASNAQLSATELRAVTKGKSRKTFSAVYSEIFSTSKVGARQPLSRAMWFRDNNARGLARQIIDPTEIAKARQTVTLVHAWCDEFLKNLPRTVSKAKRG